MYRINLSKKRSILLFLDIIVVLSIMAPNYITRFEAFNAVNKFIKMSIGIIVLFCYLFFIRKFDLYVVLVTGFEISFLLSTVLNGGDIGRWWRNGAYLIILTLFMKIMIDIDAQTLLKALSMILGMYVHINMLTRLLYPDGLFVDEFAGYKNCWFLGYDNVSAIIIVLSQTISAYRILITKKKRMIWDKSVMISGTVFLFLQQIATGILANCFFYLYIILMKFPTMRKTIGKAKLIVIVMIGLFILIQFFNSWQGGLVSLIFSMLGKDMTFTGRALTWQKAWRELFSGNIIIGFGIHNPLDYVNLFHGKAWVHLHCYYLQVLYEGGLISMMLFLAILYYPALRFDHSKKTFPCYTFLSGLAAIMLIWQVEAYMTVATYFVIVLTLLNYSSKVERMVLLESQNMNSQREVHQ